MSRSVPVLAAGATSTATSTVLNIPGGKTAGACYISAKADSATAVTETNETNNTLARSILIGPDLVVSSFTAPSTGGSPGTITVSVTTKNNGGGATTVTSTTGFYLSANSTWDAADTLLDTRSVPVLAAGATSTATSTVTTIPGGKPAGT